MDLLQLRYFIAVAETEHVTHAAESLNVAQPALTTTIKKLEKEIGFPLFERKGRGITLSKCGKYLYDYVAEAVKVIERAPGAVARFASDIKDVVKLNVLAASDCVTTAIIDYKKKSRLRRGVFRRAEQRDFRCGYCDIYRHKKGKRRGRR